MMNPTKTATRVDRHQRRKAIKILRELDAALPENEDFYGRAATVAGRLVVLTGRALGTVTLEVARALENPARLGLLVAKAGIVVPEDRREIPAALARWGTPPKNSLAALRFLEGCTDKTPVTFLAECARLTLTTGALYAAVLDVFKRSSRKST